MLSVTDLRRRLLDWYDQNARALPWRIGPADHARGVRQDPYRVWLSEVMLQQTTVPHATPYFLDFTRRWPKVTDLAAEPDGEVMAAWAGLGYYARARNLLACARAVAERCGGVFPDTEDGLLALPGVGAYTAAAVAAIAFDRPTNVVDGNVERVMARLHAVEAPLPGAKPQLKALAAQLVTAERPHRQGVAYVLTRGNAVGLVRRPDKGLLGGMLALPTSDWGPAPAPGSGAPARADWRPAGEIEHVFTHFALTLKVMRAEGPAEGLIWTPIDEAARGLPSVFLKALRQGMNSLL